MMTFQDYKQLKSNSLNEIEEAKKQYEEFVAKQKEVIANAQRQLVKDTAKFKAGDKVLKGSGKTIWTISSMRGVITGESVGHFYNLEPERNSRFYNTMRGVYEKDLKLVEENA